MNTCKLTSKVTLGISFLAVMTTKKVSFSSHVEHGLLRCWQLPSSLNIPSPRMQLSHISGYIGRENRLRYNSSVMSTTFCLF